MDFHQDSADQSQASSFIWKNAHYVNIRPSSKRSTSNDLSYKHRFPLCSISVEHYAKRI
jgi:hypothetical protein